MKVKEGLYRCNSIELHRITKDGKSLIELHLLQASSCDICKSNFDELICDEGNYIEFHTGFVGTGIAVSMQDNVTKFEFIKDSGQQFKVGKDDKCWFVTVVKKLC